MFVELAKFSTFDEKLCMLNVPNFERSLNIQNYVNFLNTITH